MARPPPLLQRTAGLVSCLPRSHVVLVPAGVHHDLLNAHVLLCAVVLAQVVIANNHTESHLAGERGGSLRDRPPPLEGRRAVVTVYFWDRHTGGQKVRTQQVPPFPKVTNLWQQKKKCNQLHILSLLS